MAYGDDALVVTVLLRAALLLAVLCLHLQQKRWLKGSSRLIISLRTIHTELQRTTKGL